MTPDLICLSLVGFALLWFQRLIHGQRQLASDSKTGLALSVVAWLLVLSGFIGLGTPFMLVPILAICGMVVWQYRNSERRILLWMLAVAAERQVPLHEAVDAFAEGRSDELGRRAKQLGDMLEQGIPLPLAIRKSKNTLPRDAMLATQLGYASDTLDVTLRKTISDNDRMASMKKALFDKSFYFLILLMMLAYVLWQVSRTPMVYAGLTSGATPRIAETWPVQINDFEMTVSPVTRLAIRFMEICQSLWVVYIFVAVIAAVWLIYGMLQYIGLPIPELPWSKKLIGRTDNPVLLRQLACHVKQQKTIRSALEVITQLYPRRRIRINLNDVATRMDRGEHWCDSLLANKLLTRHDVAILKSAERVGNLAWALDEVAEHNLNRLEHRLELLTSILNPVIILFVAVMVGVVAVALFLPIIAVVEGMS